MDRSSIDPVGCRSNEALHWSRRPSRILLLQFPASNHEIDFQSATGEHSDVRGSGRTAAGC